MDMLIIIHIFLCQVITKISQCKKTWFIFHYGQGII